MAFFMQNIDIAAPQGLPHPVDDRLLCGCSGRLRLAARQAPLKHGRQKVCYLSGKLFCILFGVGKGILRRRQFSVRNSKTAVSGLHSKDRYDHVISVWHQEGIAQFKHFCFEITRSVSDCLVPGLQVMPEDTLNKVVNKAVCVFFACDVWWVNR